MSLTIRSTMNNQAAVQGIDNADKNTDNSKQPRNRKTINVSELNLKPYNDNQIDAKRLRARKQAMKLISDAWKSADMRDKNIEDMKLDKLNKLDEITELKNKVSGLENEKEAYRADYGVDMDSQEQKDLELLEKYQNNRYGSAEDTFSKEELDRLKELQNTPLTEYQEKVLKLNSSQIHFKDEIGQKELKIACTTASIALAEIDRDKSQEMLKAQDSADQIIGAVEGEVKNLLVNEGKDNIDDKVEENKEKADEAEKKQEEQQEKIDEKRKERKEQEEIIEGQAEADKLEMNANIRSNDVDYVTLPVLVPNSSLPSLIIPSPFLSRARKPLSGFICAIVSSLPSPSMSKLKDLSETETGLLPRLITRGSVSTVSKLETNSMLCSSMYLRDMVISRLKLSFLFFIG